MKKGFLAFFPVFAFILLHSQINGQEINLAFNPPLGLEYKSEYDIQTSIDQTIMGIEQNVKAKTFMVVHSKVIENTSEYCIIEMIYKRLAVETSTAFFNMIIDSESDEEDNTVNLALKAITNSPFLLKFNHNGLLSEIDGLGDLIDKMAEVIPMNDVGREQYMQLLNQSFGKDNLLQSLSQVSPVFPRKALSEDESWEYAQNLSASEFTFILNSISTLQSLDEKNARILMRSEIKTPENSSQEIQGLKAIIALEGTQVGEVNIDLETGISMSAILSQEINGMVEIKMSESEKDNMSIPMKINSSIHMKTEFK